MDYPSASEQRELAAEFWGAHGIKGRNIKGVVAGWCDLEDKEREGLIASWKARNERQQAAAPTVAAPVPVTAREVAAGTLGDFIKQLRALGKGHAANVSTLVAFADLLQGEMVKVLAAQDKQLREHVDTQLTAMLGQARERYQAELSAKAAEISALRTERDFLKDLIDERWTKRRAVINGN